MTKRRQVETALREELSARDLPPHSPFYSDYQLSERFNASRQTIRQAIGCLVQAGLVYRTQGKGTFVAPPSKSKTILLVSQDEVFSRRSYFHMYLVNGLFRRTNPRSCEYIPAFTGSTSFVKHLSDLGSMYPRLAGVIFIDYEPLARSHAELDRTGIPYVYYGSDCVLANLPRHDTSYLVYHEAEITNMALSYLSSERGRQRIGSVVDPTVASKARRHELWKEWRLTRGAEPSPEDTIVFDRSVALKEATKKLQEDLVRRPSLDAVFCSEDYIASAVINASLRAGIRVPEDLAVIGVNNFDFCERAAVPITSVEIPLAEDMTTCVDTLQSAENAPLKNARMRSAVRLVERESA